MATNIEEIKSLLNEAKLNFKEYPGKNYIRTAFKTEKYVDTDGDQGIDIVVSLEEEGEFVNMSLSPFRSFFLYQM